MANGSVQPFLYSSVQSIHILYNGLPLLPSKLPLPMGGCRLHLIHGSFGVPKFSTQMASRSVEPFLQGSLVIIIIIIIIIIIKR